jgi:putative transcriptional regulator
MSIGNFYLVCLNSKLVTSQLEQGGTMIVYRLKEIAERKNLNRHQLSMQTGVSYPTIYRYWDGEAQAREFMILDKLCELLDCQPGDLLEFVEPTSTP